MRQSEPLGTKRLKSVLSGDYRLAQRWGLAAATTGCSVELRTGYARGQALSGHSLTRASSPGAFSIVRPR